MEEKTQEVEKKVIVRSVDIVQVINIIYEVPINGKPSKLVREFWDLKGNWLLKEDPYEAKSLPLSSMPLHTYGFIK